MQGREEPPKGLDHLVWCFSPAARWTGRSYPLHLTFELLPPSDPLLMVLQDIFHMLLHKELEGLGGIHGDPPRLASPLLVLLIPADGDGRGGDLLVLLLGAVFRAVCGLVAAAAALFFGWVLSASAGLAGRGVIGGGAGASLLLEQMFRIWRRRTLVAGDFWDNRNLWDSAGRFLVSWGGEGGRLSLLYPWRVRGSNSCMQLWFLHTHAFNRLQDGGLGDGRDGGGRGLGAGRVGRSAAHLVTVERAGADWDVVLPCRRQILIGAVAGGGLGLVRGQRRLGPGLGANVVHVQVVVTVPVRDHHGRRDASTIDIRGGRRRPPGLHLLVGGAVSAALTDWIGRGRLPAAPSHVIGLRGSALRPARGKGEFISPRTLHDDRLMAHRHRADPALILRCCSLVPLRPGPLWHRRDASHQVIHIARVALGRRVGVPGRCRGHATPVRRGRDAAHLRRQRWVDPLVGSRVTLREGRRRPGTVCTVQYAVHHEGTVSRSQRLL